MISGVILAAVLGFAAVLQATLNQGLIEKSSVATMLFYNNGIIFLLSLALLFFYESKPLMALTTIGTKFEWIYIIPSLCGFSFVLLLPIAFEKSGPLSATIALVVSQVFVSTAVQYYQMGSISMMKLVGVLIALAGALLSIISK